MPVVTWELNGGALAALEGGPRPPKPAGRDGLIVGVHKPTPETVGPKITGFIEVGNGSQMTLTPGTYKGRVFLGLVTFGIGTGVYVFEDCIFAGNDPSGSGPNGNDSGGSVVKNTGSTEPRPTVTMIDCRVDPGYWKTNKGRTKLWPELNGIFGGGFTVKRCEIKNVCDGVAIHGYNYGFVLEQSILHSSTYATGTANTGQGDQRTHCDGIQFHTGKNIRIRGNVIGYDPSEPDETKRTRHMVGYQTDPFSAAYNSGHDFENSCLMIKQEVGSAANMLIDQVMIELNWLYGGMATINFTYNATNPNRFATLTIRNNKFGRRLAGWGITRRMDGALKTVDTNNGLGWYILKSSNLDATISGNVFEDTGLPVPITG